MPPRTAPFPAQGNAGPYTDRNHGGKYKTAGSCQFGKFKKGIKKIRVFRKMTMDDLGGALGFEGKNMSVRISQYETGARIPGEDMILKLADALQLQSYF